MTKRSIVVAGTTIGTVIAFPSVALAHGIGVQVWVLARKPPIRLDRWAAVAVHPL